VQGKYHVIGWKEREEAGRRKDFGNFPSREEAGKFLHAAEGEHPDWAFEIEECSHPEHVLHQE